MSFLRRLFSGFASPPINMEAAKTKAQSLIDENAVMVFSKSYCPYCRASKKTLQSAGAQFKVYELNEESQCNHPLPPLPVPPYLGACWAGATQMNRCLRRVEG